MPLPTPAIRQRQVIAHQTLSAVFISGATSIA
jgi:hypothetical protein